MAGSENPSQGPAGSFFWIAVMAFGIMIVIAASLWGCARWQRTKGHTEAQTRNFHTLFAAPTRCA